MIVQVGNLHFAFGMEWAISHAKEESRQLKSRLRSTNSLYVCKAVKERGKEVTSQWWFGVFHSQFNAQSHPVPKKVYSAALCMAAMVQEAIIVHPLAEGFVWLCVIKAGLPVVGFDVLVPESDIASRIDGLQNLLKSSGQSVKAAEGESIDTFEVIQAFERLNNLDVAKATDARLEGDIRMARLRPLDRLGGLKCRPWFLLLSAVLGLGIVAELALGQGLKGVLDANVQHPLLQRAFLVGDFVKEWLSKCSVLISPERYQAESIRLARLEAQRQEDHRAKLKELADQALLEKETQLAQNERRLAEQQNRLRTWVVPIDFWSAFNRLRQSVPLSIMGQELHQVRCLSSYCDLEWGLGRSSIQNIAAQSKASSNLERTADKPWTHVSLNLSPTLSLAQSKGSLQEALDSMKADFSRVPLDWSVGQPLGHSMWMDELPQNATAKLSTESGKSKDSDMNTDKASVSVSASASVSSSAREKKFWLANSGEWRVTFSGETMLLEADGFIKRVGRWPMELTEIDYSRSGSLSLKGKWFYFPNSRVAQ